MSDHLMTLIDLGRLLTNAVGNLSVASGWMQEEGFLKHYQGCSAELQELSARLSSLLADLDKLTESDPELLGTTPEIRKEIFSPAKSTYSVTDPSQTD